MFLTCFIIMNQKIYCNLNFNKFLYLFYTIDPKNCMFKKNYGKNHHISSIYVDLKHHKKYIEIILNWGHMPNNSSICVESESRCHQKKKFTGTPFFDHLKKVYKFFFCLKNTFAKMFF